MVPNATNTACTGTIWFKPQRSHHKGLATALYLCYQAVASTCLEVTMLRMQFHLWH